MRKLMACGSDAISGRLPPVGPNCSQRFFTAKDGGQVRGALRFSRQQLESVLYCSWASNPIQCNILIFLESYAGAFKALECGYQR